MKLTNMIFIPFVSLTLAGCAVHADTMAPATDSALAITNVRVFDGEHLSPPRTIVVDNGLISGALSASNQWDAKGAVLLPGLIDSHVHLEGDASLYAAARWGVTTMLDMGTHDMAARERMFALEGAADFRVSGTAAAPPDSTHAVIGCIPVSTPEEAVRYVVARMEENVDYIKIIVDSPGKTGIIFLNEPTLKALSDASHARGLRVVAHTSTYEGAALCEKYGVDVITHTPLGRPVDGSLAETVAKSGSVVVPTLVMMECMLDRLPEPMRAESSYQNSRDSLKAYYDAGAVILAGTDANTNVCVVPHGESLHRELQLMVEAGMSPVEALRSATSVPATYFGFTDRGVIEPGRRADLLLVDGDPTVDISAVTRILGVWVKGVRVQ